MNKAARSARIATETSLSRVGADDAVATLFSTIDDALACGETDKIAGFGTFSMSSRPARRCRNPRARLRASPSTPRRCLSSGPAKPSARPSTSGFRERACRCRTLPMRRGVNSKGKSSGSVSAPPVRCRSSEDPIQRAVRSRPNQIARAFVANVAGPISGDFVASVERANIYAEHAQTSAAFDAANPYKGRCELSSTITVCATAWAEYSMRYRAAYVV